MTVGAAPRPLLPIPDTGRILLRANNWIGDVVIATPALAAVRRAFPSAHISVLAKPWVLPLLLHHPAVDRLLLFDAHGRHRGVRGLARLARDVKRERFDGAILLQRALQAALIAYGARIPVRAGLTTDGRGPLLTHKVPARPEIFALHRVEHNLAVLNHLGIPSADTGLHLPVGAGDLRRALQILGDAGVEPDRPLFGLNPGAAFGSAKRWMPEGFASASSRLTRRSGARGILFGSRSEEDLAASICRMAPEARLVNLAGRTTLPEALALIGLCGLFLSNDSGLMHVAAALDVPLISLFGPTRHTTTSPWCTRHRLIRKEEISCSPCMRRECPEGHHLCMKSITADEVFEAACALADRWGLEPPQVRRHRLAVSDRAVPVHDFSAGA